MRKVLVDPAALKEAAKWLEVHSSSSGSAEAFAADALREAIGQPAEAEGVDFGFDDRSVKVSQEAYSIFLARERHHLAALSAETAERDRLRKDRDDCVEARVHYAGKLGEVMAERDQLRSEAEALRKDAERLDFMLSNTHRKVVAERVGGGFLEVYVEEGFMADEQYPPVKHKGDWKDGSEAVKRVKRAAIDAAMAAKEA